jgi:hypothetical protein
MESLPFRLSRYPPRFDASSEDILKSCSEASLNRREWETDMHVKTMAMMLAAVTLLALAWPVTAQRGATPARNIRCSFSVNATGTWKKDGSAEAAVNSAKLVLQFDAINADEGTAQLRNGSVGSEIIVRSAEGYLNFIQSFRTGPLYTTTVFDKETTGGKLKAVHSRHEYFATPLPGATSSPEQYYGECEVTGR